MYIIWLGVLNEEAEERVASLKEKEFNVHHFENKEKFFENLNDTLEDATQPPITVILNFRSISSMSLELCKAIKAIPTSNPPQVYLSVESASYESREAFIDLGGDDIIIEPYSAKELIAKLSAYQDCISQRKRLEKELDVSGNMAMLAMEGSSDMGSILEFTRNALHHKNYEGIVDSIFATTRAYTECCVIEITAHSDILCFASTALNDDLKNGLKELKSENRVVSREGLLQINQSHVVVQIRDLTIADEGKLGRVSDNMSTLVEMANRFVISVNAEVHIMQLEKLRSDFINTIGHELRTRMKVIQTFSAGLIKSSTSKQLGGKHAIAMKSVHDNVAKINRIVNTIIDINSLSAYEETKEKELDMASLLRKLIEKYGPKAERKKLTIKSGSLSDFVLKTKEKFMIQILCHLLDNAVNFTKAGAIVISSYASECSEGKNMAIHIMDTGPGISELDAAILMSKDINNISRGDKEHTGLGLLYVRLFTELLGGKIEVNSVPAHGSEFVLTFFERAEANYTSVSESNNTELF